MRVQNTSIVIAGFIGIAISGPATAGFLCPQPAVGIQIPDRGLPPPNMNGQAVSFSFRSQTYPLDLYSAFAPQHSGSPSFCLRYEVVNKAAADIEKFYWPLSTLEFDNLVPNKRQSIATTKQSDRAPNIDDTWIYAFLTGAVKTHAYQTHATLKMDDRRIRIASASEASPILFAAINENATRHFLKEPEKLPTIGAEFSASGSDVAASSTAVWDGKRYTIDLFIERNNSNSDDPIGDVYAPFVSALSKGGSAINLALLKSFEDVPIPLDGDKFGVSPIFDGVPPVLYVVEQPITFVRKAGRTCFLASVYSPVPFPPNALSCKLF